MDNNKSIESNTIVTSASYRQILFTITNITIPLIIGLFIYFFLRPKEYIYEYWFKLNPLKNRLGLYSLSDVVPDFIIYNLPNALWFYSMVSFYLLLFKTRIRQLDFFVTMLVVFSLPFLLEFLQYHNIITGTFDHMDNISYIVAGILCIVVHKDQ